MVISSIALLIASVSCDNDTKKVIEHDPKQPIVLTSFQPDSGRIREMVLLDGENFGTDPSAIKVFFNEREAKVIGSTGKRILVAVPRLPGDTCTLTVEIGQQRKTYSNQFRYKVAASVTTIAGNGSSSHVYDKGLDKSELVPVYIGMDNNSNIFVTDDNYSLLRINERENLIQLLVSNDFNHRCLPYVNPRTNVIQVGAETNNNRDQFLFLYPDEHWAPRYKYIREWDINGYSLPAEGNHYHCLLCEVDGNYYTRYNSGEIVRIDPVSWNAKIIGMTPRGLAYGGAMHPIRKNEMWIAYDAGQGTVANSICKVDVLDETKGEDGLLASFQKLTGPIGNGHRDGPIHQSQFNAIRMINFDSDGNLYVGDCNNHCIRMVNTMGNPMIVETIIGIPGERGYKDGNREEALFNQPHGIVIDADNVIYVTDYSNQRIRRIAIE